MSLVRSGYLLVLGSWLLSGAAGAQPAPGPQSEPEQKPSAEPTDPKGPAAEDDSLEGYTPPGAAPPSDEGDSLEGYTPPGSAEAPEAPSKSEDDKLSDLADEPPIDEPSPLPPPGPPSASEQLPAPIRAEPETLPSRLVYLGFYGGAVNRKSEEERISYGTSFAWGVSADVDLIQYLRMGIYMREEKIPVDVEPGGFDTSDFEYPDTSFEQPDLDSIGLGFRVAPNLQLIDRVKAMVFFDLAWTRFTAPAPKSSGAKHIVSSERAGVGLNYKWGLGVLVEPVRDWLEVSAIGSYGIFGSQNGTAFEDKDTALEDVLQGFDETGHIVHLAPLPRFERSLELLFTVSLIL